MRTAYYALIISLFIHLLLYEGVERMPIPPASKKETVEIEIKPLPKDVSQNKTKQIVRDALLPDKLKADDSEDPLHFWSAQTQRVKKQTRAADFGMTKNRMNQSKTATMKQEKSGGPENKLPRLDKDALIAAAQNAGGPLHMPQMSDPGLSTIGESLPEDVQIGSFTALNTDRYLFYSFFARVEELIRFRWESSVERSIDDMGHARLEAAANNKWTTQLEVLLNPHGNFQKVLMLKESGIPAFDQAAAMAFAQARYFPNPPKEMVEEDGMIHLKYSFTVFVDPRLVARP